MKKQTWSVVLVLGLLVVTTGTPSWSQTAPVPEQVPAAGSEPTGSPVILGRDTLFHIVSPLGPFTPEERARGISRRLESLARRAGIQADSIILLESESSTDLLFDDVLLMTVTDGDATLAGLDRELLARDRAVLLELGLREFSATAGLRALMIGALLSLLTTGLAFLLLRLVRRGSARLEQTILTSDRIRPLRLQGLELLSSSKITRGLASFVRALRFSLILILFYFYFPLVLSYFPQTSELSGRLVGMVLEPFAIVGRSIAAYLPDLLLLIVIGLVTRWVLKLVRLVFNGMEGGAIVIRGFHRDWAEPTYQIVRFLAFALAVIIAWPYLPGSDSEAFKGISVFLGVLFSFGSASAIANIVSGIVMTYMRPFQVGDRVRIADTIGDVVEKTLLVTRVRTVKNVDITVPNSMVLGSHIVNYSSSAEERGVILHTTVGIGYDVPWRQVHELLIAAALATPEVLDEPEPFVLQTTLGDFAVNYELNAFTRDPNRMASYYSALHQSIQDRFNEAGIEIMSPAYTAVRDGNQSTVPEGHLPPEYRPPSFRILPIPESLRPPQAAGRKRSTVTEEDSPGDRADAQPPRTPWTGGD